MASPSDRPPTTGELEQKFPQLRLPPVPPREHLAHLQPEVEQVILRCLHPDPGQRFQTVSGLLAALAPLLRGRYRLWPEAAPIERRADTVSR